jgi:hypothetical protein
LARIQLNEQMFMGESLKMFLSNVNDILWTIGWFGSADSTFDIDSLI